VVNDSVPNAFAITGGYIFVYRGLIELMSSEGELASVLSHELGHIQLRHIQRRLEQSKILNIAALAGMLAGVLLGVAGKGGASSANAAQALSIGSLAGAQSMALSYSRENEAEADQAGLRYLCAAGYPAEDMVTAMQRLNQATWMLSSSIPSYLLTHPALNERIQYLADLAQKQKESMKRPSRSFNLDDFSVMQAALVAEYGDARVALERFEEGAKKGKASAEYGLGLLYLRAGRVAEALPHLQQAARRESNSPFVLSTLGAAYYQQGKLDEADRVLKSAILLNPSSSIAHLRLALVLQELGRKNQALEQLRTIEALAPTYPEIDYRLGVLLGQLNQLGEAHFHLGRYYEHKRDWNLALFHLKKAKALITDSPEKLEEVERELKGVESKKKQAYWQREEKK
jgi:predicted Zn-dependent protease